MAEKLIISTEFPHQSRTVGTFLTASATINSTTVPLAVGNCSIFTASGLTISGPGIPPGTTATVYFDTTKNNTLLLSQPATIPAGSLVTLGQIPLASDIANGTSGTLATPAPMSNNNYSCVASAGKIPPGTTMRTDAGSATVRFSNNVTIPAGAVLTFGTPLDPVSMRNTQLSRALHGEMSGSADVFDAYSPLEDPSDPGFFRPEVSVDGIHANDAGHAILTNGLVHVLKAAIGPCRLAG